MQLYPSPRLRQFLQLVVLGALKVRRAMRTRMIGARRRRKWK
jgi:hypothetical protein